MKKIILVRHAKSDWESASLKDFDRPLSQRGLSDAPTMAEHLIKQNEIPELIIASPAKRTTQTAKIIADKLAIAEVIFTENMYDGSEEDYIHIIECLPDNITTVMLVGHNPTITNLTNILTKSNIANIPTTGVAIIHSETLLWSTLFKTPASLNKFFTPKMLK